MQVNEIILQEKTDFTDKELFYMASPILIKRFEGSKTQHILYTDPDAGNYLTETLKNKMKTARLPEDTGLNISFDRTYSGAKTKLISYNGINNKTSLCPVRIKGKVETKEFVWNVGLGNSTGIGFGAIY